MEVRDIVDLLFIVFFLGVSTWCVYKEKMVDATFFLVWVAIFWMMLLA